MRAFVFLFPLMPFFENMWYGRPVKRAEYRQLLSRLNRLVTVRYRRAGYQIFWVFPSLPRAEGLPDYTLRTPGLRQLKGERALVTNVSYAQMRRRGQQPHWPDLLMQLPDRPSRLVVGGFHSTDSVEKFAAYSYQQGIPTYLDEDTTELFFVRMRLDGSVPLQRPRRAAAAYTRRVSRRGLPMDQLSLDCLREQRKRRPWRPQL